MAYFLWIFVIYDILSSLSPDSATRATSVTFLKSFVSKMLVIRRGAVALFEPLLAEFWYIIHASRKRNTIFEKITSKTQNVYNMIF